MRLIARERILLHLLGLVKHAEALDVPQELTQEGVAKASWIDLRHLTQYVHPLSDEGLVRERMAHVKGIRQRRKVYDLTDAGKLAATRLREKVKAAVVRVCGPEGSRDASVAQVLAEAGDRASILDIVRQSMETGTVDLTALTPAGSPAALEMISAAPRLERFVGRDAELETVTGNGDRPRVFVVRGVAGIGKSSFAAKACELLRGKRNLFWHRVRPWDTHQSLLASLGDFLSALGRPGLRSVLARGEATRAPGVLGEELPGTRSFLVFDDAHEASPEALPVLRLVKEVIEVAPDVRALVLTRQALPFYDRRDVRISGVVRELDLGGLEPKAVAALLSGEREAAKLVALSRQLRGHPLFLDLVRAHPTASGRAFGDVRRFIEEEIYTRLGEAERMMMKTASLYRIPVPREALFVSPSLSHEVLLALTDRGLIRAVGDESFEVHDTIRDFFVGFLTDSERRGIGAFAVGQLRGLASEAERMGKAVECVHYLSNALQLSTPGPEQVELREALGDANERIGDLPGVLTAYKEAIKGSTEPRVLARLHRKTASALEDRGEVSSAVREIEEGLQALGDAVDQERGWLDLVKCRAGTQLGDWIEALEHGEAALRTFRMLGLPRGQVEGLLMLGEIKTHSPHADPSRAEQYFEEALGLSGTLADPQLTTEVHQTLAHFFTYHRSRSAERAVEHIRAIEALAAATGNPHIRLASFMFHAWFDLLFGVDHTTADAGFRDSVALARRIHDYATAASARFGLALVSYFRGDIDEALGGFREVEADMQARGRVMGRVRRVRAGRGGGAVEILSMIAECHLLKGDIEGFERVVATLDAPGLGRSTEFPVLSRVLRGIDRLIKGDEAGSREMFTEAVRISEEGFAVQEAPFVTYAHTAHLFYGIALQAMGESREASEHVTRAKEILRICGLQAMLRIVPELERRLTKTLQAALKLRNL